MLTRRQAVGLALAIGIVVALLAVDAAHARRNQPKLTCTQNGLTVFEVVSDTQFAIVGSGFKANLVVEVCIDGQGCRHSDTDRSGDLYQLRTAWYDPGSYTISAIQVRNRSTSRAGLSATTVLTVN
jgi:hypothetical protein